MTISSLILLYSQKIDGGTPPCQPDGDTPLLLRWGYLHAWNVDRQHLWKQYRPHSFGIR